ncbi:hypothetical protein F4778DRAFT_787819 [Xylariomycetidae sp. FL2044]|nr:hypothetical protein F4778DRAFT_787819 [Xylariomycetidae sp. FL2044]
MAGHGGWDQRPPFSSHSSQQSLSRPSSSFVSGNHRRVASDEVSIESHDRQGNSQGYSRISSPPIEQRQQWIPMGPASPPTATSTPAAWHEAGDLGSPYHSHTFYEDSSLEYPNPATNPSHNYPAAAAAAATPASRYRPAPMHLEDRAASFASPAGSSAPFFSPRDPHRHQRIDSQPGLNFLNTPPEAPTPPPYSATAGPKNKGLWLLKSVWKIYAFFILGILFAVGHHIFYHELDGRPADDQVSMLRYGTILAFASKAGLSTAVILAFKQRVWTTVRNKLLSLAALDSLFAAAEDLSALLSWEAFKQAKTAMLLASFVWLTPLVVILTSATLAVEPGLTVVEGNCPGIRTLNFDKEALEQWRTPTKIAGLIGTSVSLYNSTSTDTSSPDWWDYWTGPSGALKKVVALAAFQQGAQEKTGAGMDVCGPGWNCTYVVNFTAPAYRCSEQASGAGSEVRPLGDQKPPEGFTTDLLLPRGNFSYYAYTSGGDYGAQLNATASGGMPLFDPPFPEDLGAFRTEPVLWMGYSVRVDEDATPNNASEPGWDEAFVPKVIACVNYEAEYVVRFNLTGGQQFTNVTQRTFLRPVVDTTWDQDVMADDGTADNTTAHPKSNYVRFHDDAPRYRRVAAFHSIASQLRSFVNGTVDSQIVGNPIANTDAIQTKLMDPFHEYFAYPNLAERLQEFYEDIVFSLLSEQKFLSVVWAAKPDVASGVLAGDDSTSYPCVRSRTENRYSYHVRDLWIVYTIAVVLSLAGIVSGTLAVLENEGVLRNTRFSSIVAATRGPALEKLAAVAADRGKLPKGARNLKVGYGIVHRPASSPGLVREDTSYLGAGPWDSRGDNDVRYGFGVEGDVRQMRRESMFFRQK